MEIRRQHGRQLEASVYEADKLGHVTAMAIDDMNRLSKPSDQTDLAADPHLILIHSLPASGGSAEAAGIPDMRHKPRPTALEYFAL
jgi:hypothetical protein